MVAERAGDEKTGNPIQFVWSKIGNYKIDGNTITGDVLVFEPTLFKWMGFLTGYVLPKAYYEKVGAEGFEKAPVGSGPYKVDEFQQNAFLRSRPSQYWGGEAGLRNSHLQVRPDATSRVAEIESGKSDVDFEIPYEEFDRLKAKSGLAGYPQPVSDIAMIFINDVAADARQECSARGQSTRSTRRRSSTGCLAATASRSRRWRRREYAAFDPSIKVPYDPEQAKELLAKSGYSPDNPVKFTIQTTRGFKPKDYEMIQAIVGMWRKVGIEADDRGLRDRQALRAARRRPAGAGRLLQLGQLDRRSVHLHRLCHVRPLAAFASGTART